MDVDKAVRKVRGIGRIVERDCERKLNKELREIANSPQTEVTPKSSDQYKRDNFNIKIYK
jgi:hypothetical protein